MNSQRAILGLEQRLQRSGAARSVFAANDTRAKALALDELMCRIDRLRGRARVLNKSDKTALDIGAVLEALGGRFIADGLLCIDRHYPMTHRHGCVLLQDLLDLRRDQSGYLAFKSEIDPAQLLFLDIETSGLSGGSGNLAFMLGLARLQGEQLLVRQYLITRYAAERSLLHALRRETVDMRHIVSFNGKSFDIPILRMRLALQRETDAFSGMGHIDLLHALRRARKHGVNVLPDCRLQTAEACLLRMERKDDLPGAQAPKAWLRLVRAEDVSLIGAALEHNCLDVLSMAALLPQLAQARHGRTLFA